MDDKLDKKLKYRITEVFDNYVDASADEGWVQLRKKFPVEQSRRRSIAWLWWASTAAVLMLFLGIGLWKVGQKGEVKRLSAKTTRQHQYKHNAPAEPNGSSETATVKPMKSQTGERNNGRPKTSLKNTEQAFSGVNDGSKMKSTQNDQVSYTNSHVTMNNVRKGGSSVAKAIDENYAITKAQNSSVPEGKDTSQQPAIAVSKPVQANPVVPAAPATPLTAPAMVNAQKPKTINEMFSADAKGRDKKIKEPQSKSVRFGVYAATYFNYAKGSSNRVNTGAGVTADIALTAGLKLQTGIAVNQNSLSFGNSVSGIAGAAGGLMAVSANSSNGSGAAIALSTNYLNSVASVKNYSANLVGLDIPLNLKYSINPQKDNLYVIAGVSSGTFINEAYTFNYANSFNLSQSQTETSKSFGSFYFAKTLNVAFGVGYPVGKNRLFVEPFLKYPLEGVGAQQIHFGAGGINLKFSFLKK